MLYEHKHHHCCLIIASTRCSRSARTRTASYAFDCLANRFPPTLRPAAIFRQRRRNPRKPQRHQFHHHRRRHHRQRQQSLYPLHHHHHHHHYRRHHHYRHHRPRLRIRRYSDSAHRTRRSSRRSSRTSSPYRTNDFRMLVYYYDRETKIDFVFVELFRQCVFDGVDFGTCLSQWTNEFLKVRTDLFMSCVLLCDNSLQMHTYMWLIAFVPAYIANLGERRQC
jgi:hypothetical protein